MGCRGESPRARCIPQNAAAAGARAALWTRSGSLLHLTLQQKKDKTHCHRSGLRQQPGQGAELLGDASKDAEFPEKSKYASYFSFQHARRKKLKQMQEGEQKTSTMCWISRSACCVGYKCSSPSGRASNLLSKTRGSISARSSKLFSSPAALAEVRRGRKGGW